MKKLTCLLLCLMLLCGTALADGTFTCGLCGWTGAAVKFCGGCGAEIALQWTCVQCGNTNSGTKFCGECGTQRPVAEDSRWTCTSCGNTNNGTKFCGECGTQRPVVEDLQWTCAFCGNANDGTKFCGECGAKKQAAAEVNIQPGDFVTFGHYPQTKEGNDMTPIEWIVLDRDGSKALLISRYALDSQKYNTSRKSVTWETCSLRKWLNETFSNKAFTTAEQGSILTTAVDNSDSQGNSKWSTNGGNDTQDKVFLLSYAEADKYFKNDDARKCALTDYAVKQGGYKSNSVDGIGTGGWWLRSPGSSSFSAASVDIHGWLGRNYNVNYSIDVVRPVMWVDLDSGVF